MVLTNKKLIDELKRYNKDLEKHVSGVDLELVNKSLKSNSPNSESAEFHSLFAQNLLDLRTEISLLRKNLSVDIEGMVMRVVTGQQNQFSEKMNSLFLETTFDMKRYLNETIGKFGDEITQIKKSYNDMSIQNENLSSEISNLTGEVTILKSKIESQDLTAQTMDLQRKLEEVDFKLDSSTKLIFEKDKQLHENLQRLFNSLDEISNFSKTLPSLISVKKPQISSINVLPPIKIQNEHKDVEIIHSSELPSQSRKKFVLDNSSSFETKSLKTPTMTSELPNKILDIDARLNKLNSLK